MPSLVPDFIINPVLRQARRLSSNFAAGGPEPPLDKTAAAPLDHSAVAGDGSVPSPVQASPRPRALPMRSGPTAAEAVTRLAGSSSTAKPDAAAPSPAVAVVATPRDVPFRGPMARHARTTSLQEQPAPRPSDVGRLVSGRTPTATADPAAAVLSSSAPSQGQAHRVAALRASDGPDEAAATAGADHGRRGDAADAPDRTGSGSEITAGPLSAGFYGNTELPEDDGMSSLRRRILDVQARPISAADKARLMHGLLMEGYNMRARKTAATATATATARPARPPTPASPTAAAPPSPRPSRPPPQSEAESSPLSALESLKFWHASSHARATPTPIALTDDDLQPTYVPGSGPGRDDGLDNGGDDGDDDDDAGCRTPLLGCEHYRRNVKMQCATCERWYTCRLCHNDAEDHTLPRRETKNMLCMLCGHAQRASDVCAKCGEAAARYYCGICKLWNDDPDKSIYHCGDCGICRVGEGLGKDFFHCKKCGSCIAINQEESHRCREGVMDCDCPICSEYIFTTHKKVVTMKCGHMIHDDCRAEYIKRSYKCPICNKSVENMESMFRRLDKHLEEQPMPDEYQATRAVILCNDCEAKTSTKYHWGGLRCEICLSYNTVELLLLNAPPSHHGRDAVTAGAAASASASSASSAASAAAPTTSSSSYLSPPSPPLSASSPRSDASRQQPPPSSALLSRSPPPTMSFRSASPAFMVSPARAPVLATAPPGYSEEGFALAGDEDDYQQSSDMEDADILGLFDRRALSWGRRKVSPYFGGGKSDGGDGEDEEEDDDDEDDEDDEEDDDEDEEDDDDDDEEEIQLFGHP